MTAFASVGALAGLAILGGLFGSMLPSLIARIPDRAPASEGPAPTSYRDLAAGANSAVLVLTTAAVWLLIGVARAGISAGLPTHLLIGGLGVAMAYVDLKEHRLPDRLTLPALGIGAVGLAIAALITGEWDDYGRAWLASVAVCAFYFVLLLIRPADLGLGDVKLAAVIGLLLGWVSWSTVVSGVFFGFLCGGLVGAALMLARRANRRTALPFGPAMLIGALAALVVS